MILYVGSNPNLRPRIRPIMVAMFAHVQIQHVGRVVFDVHDLVGFGLGLRALGVWADHEIDARKRRIFKDVFVQERAVRHSFLVKLGLGDAFAFGSKAVDLVATTMALVYDLIRALLDIQHVFAGPAEFHDTKPYTIVDCRIYIPIFGIFA